MSSFFCDWQQITKRTNAVVVSLVLALGQLVPLLTLGSPVADARRNNNVRICHATNSATNPYSEIEVDENSVDGIGQGDHYLQHTGPLATSLTVAQQLKDDQLPWGDIIPPIEDTHEGLNWSETGQAIYNAGCSIATVEVKKSIVPTDDGGKFNLKIEGAIKKVDAAHGESTGEVYVNHNENVTVAERAGTGSDLARYMTTVVCRNDAGSGQVVEQGNPASVNERADTIDAADIEDGDKIVCVFTNTRKTGNLVVNKVVINDNGGTKVASDFSYQINGEQTVQFEQDGSNTQSLVPGTYSVIEVADVGYSTTYNNCTNIQIQEGETKTCTITNNDRPASITVNKVVINDNGGTKAASDFGFKINGSSTIQFEADGSNTISNLSAGTYSVTEPLFTGYSAAYQGCANIQLKNGDSAVCTITNNDQQGTLIVKKNLINDNGGNDPLTAFSFKVNGGQSVAFNSVGEVGIPVNAGTYSVVENSTNGRYAVSYNNCTNVNVPNGGSAICTITNNDIQPKLTVTKIVVENWNGPLGVEDFPLSVKNTQLNVTTAVTSGVQTGFNAGSYKVSEQNQPGYSAGVWRGDCSSSGDITLRIGREYACTITNYDKPGKLIVKKVLINDNGGTKKKSDFEFTINGGQSYRDFESDGENQIYVAAGIYTVRENETDEYTTTYSSGCNQAMIANDQTVTCTITNNDKPATLIVEKVVVNDNGGQKEEDDFSFRVNNGYSRTFESDGSNSITVNAGTYSVKENEDEGYEASYELSQDSSSYRRSQYQYWHWDDDDDQHGHHEENECSDIKLKPGETKTCIITNDDKPGKLIVKKVVINDNGGTLKKNDFSFIVDDGEPEQFNYYGQNTITVDAGWHQVTEVEHDDYSTSYRGCNTYVKNGYTNTCVIVNNDKAPKITVIKCTNELRYMQPLRYYANEDDEQEQLCPFGSEEDQDFTFDVKNNNHSKQFVLDTDTDSPTPQQHTTGHHFQAGVVTVTEQSSENWSLEEIRCTGDVDVEYLANGFTAQVSVGDELTCYFDNEEHSEIVVTKYNDVDEDGDWDKDESVMQGWTINLDGLCEQEWYIDESGPNGTAAQCCESYDERVLDDVEWYCAQDVYSQQKITDQNGSAVFAGLKRGGYELSEEMQAGWQQSVNGIDCSYEYNYSSGYENEENSYYVYPSYGETIYCSIGNHRSPEFILAKSNDATASKQRGQIVTYTLTVTVPETSGRVYDSNGFDHGSCEECEYYDAAIAGGTEEDYQPVVVVDLPPADFTYISGSWTAASNVRGDLKAQGITTDPAYASPGIWSLTSASSGFLTPGEVITLTYKAVIGNSVATATHPDSAFAQGFDKSGNRIYANGSLNPFVGTKVSIVDPLKTSGFVLGTSVLVDTGRAAFISMLVGVVLVLIVMLLSVNRNIRLQSKAVVLVLSTVTVFVCLAMFSSATNALSLATIQIPNTTTNTRNFNVNYTIQTTEETEDFSVKLYINGVESGSQSTTKPFGDSGQFPVALSNDGVYTFQIKAVGSGTEVASSQLVSTTVDTASPSVATFEGTLQQGNRYTVRFSVPAGSDAQKATIYASTAKRFMLDSSTKIATLPVTVGLSESYIFEAPTQQQYYFAVVLEDAAGNISASVGDVESSVSSEGQNSVATVVTAPAGGQVKSEQNALDESRINQPFDDQNAQNTEQASKDSSSNALYIAGGVIMAIALYAVFSRMRSNAAEAALLSKSSKKSSASSKKALSKKKK